MTAKWIAWQQVTSLIQADDGVRVLQAVEQLVDAAVSANSDLDFLRTQLHELAGELAAHSVGVYLRTPEWVALAQHGRLGLNEMPKSLLMDVLDRDAGFVGSMDAIPGTFIVVTPLHSRAHASSVLVFAGRSFPDDALPSAMLMSKAIGACLDFLAARSKSTRRIEQLQSILKISLNLSAVHETEPLLELIAREATRLLDCDRASIFIWDKDHHEVVACPALGVEGNSLRLPDSTGIVGEVIHTGKTLRVDDAYHDSRFSRKVDMASGYKTRNLLCGPLHGSDKKLLGAFEVINKNSGSFSADDEQTLADLSLQVAVALQNTREREVLLRSHRQLTEQVTKGVTIIGDSSAMQAMRSTIRRLAATDLPVLILGESGTGKEVVAQSLHYQGPRASRPFIAVNCAALTETLLESELFGHEKGAFTDAREMHRGKFEVAEGGTIFLDEIGDMSPGGQAKLLRVLEQKVITRVGGSQSIPINARVIAATNAHLADAVRAKKFREDLYFRLNVVTLDLPSLRDRPDDILPLAEHFLNLFAIQARRANLQLSADARSRLQAHTWPGNVRELRNLMERVAFLAPGEKVETEDLAFILSPEQQNAFEPSLDLGLGEATNSFQQEFIRRAIKRVKGNMSEAARLLGLHRSNLYRKMRQLGMTEASKEDDEEFE
ncbi:sigma-54-dependent Fis family transcriptional regulator [Schlesneria paludicola]|uniref:sigma-54-dependent Fis family transcriptional regulator n=1 Tax=Schlesneria paludicola TaxID=360056 RepID=UPI0002E37CAC|nr:sigma-54-dependent Fis family transcriptional regulator [Schlesneria paludicola]